MIVGKSVTTSMPFRRLIPVDDPEFIFTDYLYICDLDLAPDYLWRNPRGARMACTLHTDLSTVPVSNYRIQTNSQGQKFYRVDYELAVKVQDEVYMPCAQGVIALLTCIGVNF